MKLAWLTDIHLNALSMQQRQLFYSQLQQCHSDAITISGDITKPHALSNHLSEMAEHCQQPIYFVLGNHDYHREPMEAVRSNIKSLCQKNPLLHWLSNGMKTLDEGCAIVGTDGWADGRLGNYHEAAMHSKNHCMALDFHHHQIAGKYSLLKKMQQVADCEALCLKQQLQQAKQQGHEQIIVTTHFPPFQQSSRQHTQPCDQYNLPFFSSKIMGDTLLSFADSNPSIKLKVYCGHTHSRSFFLARDNLSVHTGHAVYGRPNIQRLINIS